MATWLRDDSDLTTAPGINSTTVGTNLTISGNEIDVSSGDLLIDVAGILTLDTNSGNILLKDNTTTFGSLNNSSGNLLIKSGTSIALTFSGANATFEGSIKGIISAGDGSSENFVVEQDGLLLKRTATQVVSDLGITDNEILDWTTDQGGNNIHVNNITGDLTIGMLTLAGEMFHTGTDILKLTAKESDNKMIFGVNSGATDIDSGYAFYTGNTIRWSNQYDASKSLLSWDINTTTAGASTKMSLSSTGDLLIGGNLTISGGNITNAVTFDSGITNVGTISAGTWSGTALVAGKVPDHDDLNGFVVNEHINWTLESAGTIHASNYLNTQLSTEQVQDIVGAMFTSNDEVNITAEYQDGDGTIDLTSEIGASDISAFKNEEQIQDIVGAMFSGNTETNTAVTYQDEDGTIDVVTTLDGAPLTTESVQDIVGAMFSSNTETRIAATYVDGGVGAGKINLVADDMTANTNQLTVVSIAADSGSNAFLAHGQTLDITGGSGISTTVSTSGDGTVDTVSVAVSGLSIEDLDNVTLGSGALEISSMDEIVSGSLKFNSSGHINFEGCAAGFTRTTYVDAADVTVDFKTGNKAHLDMTGGNITGTLTLQFPLVSGNFVLVVEQDGSARTIAAYATKDAAGNAGNNDGGTGGAIRWAGGSAPDLTDGGNKRDVLSFYWDATEEVCYGVASLNF